MLFFKKHKHDILLVGALLLLALALLGYRAATREQGGAVEVTVDGAVVMTLPLSRDTTVTLGDGGHTNTLVIADGAAFVTDADCPDRVCVHRGAIRCAGESIVCLPHRLVIAVVGGADGGTDILSQ